MDAPFGHRCGGDEWARGSLLLGVCLKAMAENTRGSEKPISNLLGWARIVLQIVPDGFCTFTLMCHI